MILREKKQNEVGGSIPPVRRKGSGSNVESSNGDTSDERAVSQSRVDLGRQFNVYSKRLEK